MAQDKPVTLAAIVGAHGVTGEVRVKLFGEGVATLSAHRSFNDGALTLSKLRDDGKGGAIARFAEVADRTAAEKLRGTALAVPRSALPPLAEGEYYLVDLIGATVTGPDGPVGEVTGIAAHPSIASVEVRLRDGRQAEQLLSAPWVARVDAEARVIELANLDGLVL